MPCASGGQFEVRLRSKSLKFSGVSLTLVDSKLVDVLLYFCHVLFVALNSIYCDKEIYFIA